MKYFFTENEKEIEVPIERWAWGVVYEDGSELHQFEDRGEQGVFHRIGEIEQDKIKMAVLYQPENLSKRIDIDWKKGMRIIHKYRNFVFDYMSENPRKEKAYIFGYKDGEAHSILFILPDDRIVFSSNPDCDLMKFGL